jgi:peroxiredoxin
LAVFALAVLAHAQQPGSSSPVVGRPAPEFSADAIGGKHLSLADYRGKPLVMVFWSTG